MVYLARIGPWVWFFFLFFLSFVNMQTEQATETVTIRTFSNQKPWVDRTIRAAVHQRTATYNGSLLSGNMSEYRASCYALRRAVRAAKLRYRERIKSHFQLNESWLSFFSFGNKSFAEVRADPLLANELNTFYEHLLRKQQTEQRWSCNHRVRGRGSEGTKESERQESTRTWWD